MYLGIYTVSDLLEITLDVGFFQIFVVVPNKYCYSKWDMTSVWCSFVKCASKICAMVPFI